MMEKGRVIEQGTHEELVAKKAILRGIPKQLGLTGGDDNGAQ